MIRVRPDATGHMYKFFTNVNTYIIRQGLIKSYLVLQWAPVIRSSGTAYNVLITGIKCIGVYANRFPVECSYIRHLLCTLNSIIIGCSC